MMEKGKRIRCESVSPDCPPYEYSVFSIKSET